MNQQNNEAVNDVVEPVHDSTATAEDRKTGRKAKIAAFPCVIAILIAGGIIFWPTLRPQLFVVAVGPTVAEDEQVSIADISHRPWDELLRKHVTNEGLVDYDEWKASAGDVQKLDDYLNHLSHADRSQSATTEQQLAFWINAYNALTVKGILREYPTTSIRNHTGSIGYNIWDHYSLRVGNQPYSLSAIEHEVLRKMDEPRIHFAIVCASIGCPRLLNRAFEADQLFEQLDGNAKNFFAQQRNFQIDEEAGTVHVSPILEWFATDFGSDSAAQLNRIRPYLPNDKAMQFVDGDVKIAYLDYDWNINRQ